MTTGTTAPQAGGATPKVKGSLDGWAAAGGVVLAAAVIAAYSRTFSVPFLFDDVPSIVDNPSLRHLVTAFLPPGNSTVSGRPVLNVSLAINYAISGTSVWSYHVANLAVHVLASLTLFGILRRTLTGRMVSSATPIAFWSATLWALHPLLTESVTYVVQRAESLMGLFYLLTVYGLIRGASSEGQRRKGWYGLCLAACLLGMGTKEVMASAPLVAFLFDRTFLAGSFAEAWRRRRWLYSGLAATWLALLAAVLSTHGRGGTAGFGAGVPWWSYALTQLPAIVHYLRLCVWPVPLVFDYGIALAQPSARVLACALLVAGLVAATVWAVVRRPAVGFLGAFFFAVLAPSSSVIPVVTETMAEHRMYLPLAPVVALGVIALQRGLRRGALPLFLLLSGVLFWATWRRNEMYHSEEQIWDATASDLPGNERAQNNLGNMLAKEPGRLGEAIAHFNEALRLEPGYADAHYNLGVSLDKIAGRTDQAIAQYESALRLEPTHVEALNNLGNDLAKRGRTQEAIARFELALRLEPGHVEAHYNMGNALSILGRPEEAIAEYEKAVLLDPDHLEAHYNLGNALSKVTRRQEAIVQYREALRLKPDYVEAHYNLGNALAGAGRAQDAVVQFEDAVRLRPAYADAHYNLGNALDSLGRTREAILQFQEAVRLNPDLVEAHNNLGCDLEKMPGRLGEAVDQFEDALRLKPDHVEAHYNLGSALQRIPGRMDRAIAQYREALHLNPDHLLAHYNLGNALSATGRTDEAIAQYQEALRLAPDDIAALCNLGIALKTQGRIQEAIARYEEALRLNPDDVTVLVNFAVALLKVPGRTDDAVVHLRRVLRLQPDNVAAAQILAQLGRLQP